MTLVEIMVAVLVLAIGLLAVAGLQASSLRSTYASLERSLVMVQMENFSELIRANPEDARDGDFVVANCEAANGLGLQQWIEDVQNAARSEVCPEVTWSGEIYTVSIGWADERTESENAMTMRIMP
tara:strand:- start:2701 stop:3078 length:378 start_codon:yes stop_codon:yes gene_type:complete